MPLWALELNLSFETTYILIDKNLFRNYRDRFFILRYNSNMNDETSKKVLIVEDDSGFRMVLQGLFGHEYGIMIAEDGEQAIERTLSYKPHVIVLDLLLPKIDGFEVLKRIRSYPDDLVKDIPVIVLSNLASNEDFLKAQNLTISGYFVKSELNFEEVKNKVRLIVGRQGTGLHDDPIDFRNL